jgi:alkaline phosphatase
MAKGRHLRQLIGILFLILALVFSVAAASADQPKYVFFFLGDGMASAQIQATEAYLASLTGNENEAQHLLKPDNRLNMTGMPVQGMQTTYDSLALMTDSASAGTAFACGVKTESGVIGMDSSKTVSYKSVAQLAKEAGRKVGIVTSVSLNHATPASYYASVSNRGMMNSIATQMAQSGYEFFGGGGITSATSPNNIWNLLGTNGYEVRKTRDDILALKNAPRDKVVAINPTLTSGDAMPYAIDKPAENLSLAEMTEVAIAVLTGDTPGRSQGRGRGHAHGRGRDTGFFLMVEGGKIDWACHANDAMATIGDMLDFDEAVGVALEFYRQYPSQTLIIVTGDHETGGMTIGHASTGYQAYYSRLHGQKMSFEHFGREVFAPHKEENGGNGDITSSGMIHKMEEAFGLVYETLNEWQKERLRDAYRLSMTGSNGRGGYTRGSTNNIIYGGYEPIIVTITQVLNERASIGWTSYMHTGVPVPVYAQGRKAEMFAGFYDNTDIAKRIAQILKVRQELPIQK